MKKIFMALLISFFALSFSMTADAANWKYVATSPNNGMELYWDTETPYYNYDDRLYHFIMKLRSADEEYNYMAMCNSGYLSTTLVTFVKSKKHPDVVGQTAQSVNVFMLALEPLYSNMCQQVMSSCRR